MIDIIYCEEEVANHPRAKAIIERFSNATVIPIERYGEVFNRRNQNFRLQKQRPGLILAAKHDKPVLPAPPGYGIGGAHNYYFSHMLNCIYDCRYCFLQGMYASAHYIVFVNFEDFATAIAKTASIHEQDSCYFFSGYDGDSLAFDAITGFSSHFLRTFRELPHAWLELRTKSIAIQNLLKYEALDNVIVAFSLTPDPIARRTEHKAPPIARRIQAMKQLANQGWKIGLRFDPLIHDDNFQRYYSELIHQTLHALPPESIHSVSIGPLRFPRAMFTSISRLYPEEPMLAALSNRSASLQARLGQETRDPKSQDRQEKPTQSDRVVSYPPSLEAKMDQYVRDQLRQHLPEHLFFSCVST